jgi:hypothetical protein
MPHSLRHKNAVKVMPYISVFTYLCVFVASVIGIARHLLGYGYVKDDFTAYDAITSAFMVAAGGTTASLWLKSESRQVKAYVTNSSFLWLVSFALFTRYFSAANELLTWKGLLLVYFGMMSAVVFLLSRQLDAPEGRRNG